MHEVSIIKRVIEIAEYEARRAGAERVSVIRVRVGEFRGVVASSLEFAYDQLRVGTLVEGARLEIETTPFILRCEKCGEYRCPLPGLSFFCPQCGMEVVVAGGRDLEVEYVEVV